MILVIDATHLAYIEYYSKDETTVSDLVNNLIDYLKPDHVFWVWDMMTELSWRSRMYPQYKINREGLKQRTVDLEPLRAGVKRLQSLFGNDVQAPEGDDAVAFVVSTFVELGQQVTILTSDKDMLQLVETGKVSVIRLSRKSDTSVYKVINGVEVNMWSDDSDVISEFGCEPKFVPLLKALAGDKSDNIIGVGGVGPKTAAILISQFGFDLDSICEATGHPIEQLLFDLTLIELKVKLSAEARGVQFTSDKFHKVVESLRF